jgi:hypothetical protein
MRLARLEREPQRLAGAEQMILPHELLERARAQSVGKRSLGLFPREEGTALGVIH